MEKRSIGTGGRLLLAHGDTLAGVQGVLADARIAGEAGWLAYLVKRGPASDLTQRRPSRGSASERDCLEVCGYRAALGLP